MPLGTLDRTPPPFFRQGPSALTKLVFFSALAVFLMAADTRFKLIQPLRAALATVLHPGASARCWRRWRSWRGGSDYLRRPAGRAGTTRTQARAQLATQAERAPRVEQLAAENTRLRALLELRRRLRVRSLAAEVLYEATDPYSRKVVHRPRRSRRA